MKKMKKFAALLLAVSMAAGMVACGSSDKKEETTKKEETKKDDKETKKLEGTLKVVTTGDAYQPLFDKFTEEVGPKVEFISMSSGEVLSKLKAEGGTPAADLWFGGGIDFVLPLTNSLGVYKISSLSFSFSLLSIRSTTFSPSFFPISITGTPIVVSGTCITSANGTLSNPIIEISSGIETPYSLAAR